MQKFKITASFAGPFAAGQIVSDKQIEDAKCDIDFFKAAGAIQEITEAELSFPETEPSQTIGELEEIEDPALQAAAQKAVDATDASVKASDAIAEAAKGKKKPETETA